MPKMPETGNGCRCSVMLLLHHICICYDRWTESTGQSTGRPVDVPVVIFVFRPLAALPMSSTYQSDDWHTSLLTGLPVDGLAPSHSCRSGGWYAKFLLESCNTSSKMMYKTPAKYLLWKAISPIDLYFSLN